MTKRDFHDHFSGHASDYAAHRPTYPSELFSWIAEVAPSTELAWDCGTGNGQAAVALAEHFDHVVATDASRQQIAAATRHPKVEYRVCPAEQATLDDGCADAIVVAQALHWFDIDAFLAEARRVGKPSSIVAAVTYARCYVTPEVDAQMIEYYKHVVGPYWPRERKQVERSYDGISLALDPVEPPAFTMRHDWRLDDLLGYLGTWSASKRYEAAEGRSPVDVARAGFVDAWGNPEERRVVSFPLTVLAGRLPGG